MNITRAVITAASRDDRHLPLQSVQIIVEEAVAVVAHEVGIVVRPGDEPVFREAAGASASRLKLNPQAELRG
jgi:hypothetical protein